MKIIILHLQVKIATLDSNLCNLGNVVLFMKNGQKDLLITIPTYYTKYLKWLQKGIIFHQFIL